MTEPARPRQQSIDQAMLALREGRAGEAERYAAEAVRRAPGDAIAVQALGHALLLLGRPAEAIAPLRAAADASNDAATRTLLGRVLAAAGETEAALAELERATEQRPPFPLAFVELGDRLGEAGRLDEAAVVFEAGLALAPDAAVLRVGLGRFCMKRNDRARARRLFEEALGAGKAERHDALVGLAKATALDGDHAAAAELYRKALTRRPGDAATRIELGRCLLELGERERGEEALRTAAKAAPELAGLALTTLAEVPHGRLFVRRSDAAAFLGVVDGRLAETPGQKRKP